MSRQNPAAGYSNPVSARNLPQAPSVLYSEPANMPVLAELEFQIGARSLDKSGYPITSQLSISGQEQVFPADVVNLDPDELFLLRGEQDKYNARLSEVFFQAIHVRQALITAQAQVDQAGPGNMLRIRLLIEPEAQELQHIRWECLRDTVGKPLFNGDVILFSRYLSSLHLQTLSVKNDLTALIAIANPPNLDQAINPEDPSKGLPPVDVANEKLRAEIGLKAAGFAVTTLASPPFGILPATLANIVAELEKGYDVLHLVCHGGMVPAGTGTKAMLWLEDGEDPVEAARLVEAIRNMAQQPRLVVLASCQSAGADGASVAASGTLGAVGPALAEAGVSAVIAMQGNIRMTTVEVFLPKFFAELAEDGQIDRAVGKARGHTHDMDCADYWMPTLFMRPSGGMIWNDPDYQIKKQAWAAFNDWSKLSMVLPLGQASGEKILPGEIKPDDPTLWKTISAAPNLLSYAILRSFGAGRILAVGHEHLIGYQDKAANNYFLEQAMSWLKNNREANLLLSAKPTDTLAIFPGPLFSLPVLRNIYSQWNFHTDVLTDLGDSDKLAKTAVLVICNAWGDFTPREIAAVAKFVTDGGGLLASGIGWSWQQYGPHGRRNATPTALDTYPMNRLFRNFGASWTEYQTPS